MVAASLPPLFKVKPGVILNFKHKLYHKKIVIKLFFFAIASILYIHKPKADIYTLKNNES